MDAQPPVMVVPGMNSFDFAAVNYINSFAGHVQWFDALMHGFTTNYLLKGAPLMALVYACWFIQEKDSVATRANRARLLAAIAASVLAPVVVRLIAISLPTRVRPVNDPLIHFRLPLTMVPGRAVAFDWSCFPSDTAALYFALVMGVITVSRRLGLVALALAVTASFARVYTGVHYPTDIAAGALVGVVVFLGIERTALISWIAKPALYVQDRNPGLFYAAFFLVTDQSAHILWESMLISRYLVHAIGIH
jgi:membrane-associated phospholipid phosphatase